MAKVNRSNSSKGRPSVKDLLKIQEPEDENEQPEEGEAEEQVAERVEAVIPKQRPTKVEIPVRIKGPTVLRAEERIPASPESEDEENDPDEDEDDSNEGSEDQGETNALDFAHEEGDEHTIGGFFLNRVFKHDQHLGHRLIADLMLTDLADVSDALNRWYRMQKPATFKDYEVAKDNTFQFLIKHDDYGTMFDEEVDFSHAVAHWFVTTMGLRKVR